MKSSRDACDKEDSAYTTTVSTFGPELSRARDAHQQIQSRFNLNHVLLVL